MSAMDENQQKREADLEKIGEHARRWVSGWQYGVLCFIIFVLAVAVKLLWPRIPH
jgi:hypothetical protein